MLLEVRGLVKNFGGLSALKDITFGIKEGELLGLVGPNGSGKTTLFNVICGIYRPTRGNIFFNGQDITRLSTHKIARIGIGRTFQFTTIFSEFTVIRNLVVAQCMHSKTGAWKAMFGTHDEDKAMLIRAMEIAELLGLRAEAEQLARNLPQELQKRLSIGLSLATGPKLLLLDEPTSGINMSEIGGVIEVIRKIAESGVTVCLIEHKMRIVMNLCQRVMVLNYGNLLADGTPAEVSNNKDVVDAYLGSGYAT